MKTSHFDTMRALYSNDYIRTGLFIVESVHDER